MGYPLGSHEYCRNFYNEKAEETEKYVDKSKELTKYGHEIAKQSSYLLLRYCCEPKIAHLLRAAPPEEFGSMQEEPKKFVWNLFLGAICSSWSNAPFAPICSTMPKK
jgi:hypothetical protein